MKSGNKRVSASPRNGHSSVIAHFDDIMSGSKNIKVDPESCVRLTKVRGISESGVCRLMALYNGENQITNNFAGAGIALGTDIPIVVELTGSLRPCIYKHFEDLGLSGKELEDRVKSRSKWLGIIDGQHSHEAIMRLRSKHDRWVGFLWFVCLVRGGQPVHRYQQLARFQNARHDSTFFVESTFFDLISNLKQEYKELKSKKSSCSGAAVVKSFTGTEVEEKQFRTLVQTANAVVRLPDAVIETIGDVCDSEYADLCLSSNNTHGSKTASDIMKLMDCRVFRNMLNITSLKSSRVFMNASGEDEERAQLLTIFRARDVCQDNMFKPVRHDMISKLFQLSLDAIKEEKKFMVFLSPSNWPEEMAILRSNLLRSTILDTEMESNRSKKGLLKSLQDSFRRHFPMIAPQKEAKFNVTIETDDDASCKEDKNDASGEESINGNSPPTTDTTCEKNDAFPAATGSGGKEDEASLSGNLPSISAKSNSNNISKPNSETFKNQTMDGKGNDSCGTTNELDIPELSTVAADHVRSKTDAEMQGNNPKSDQQLLVDVGITTHNIGWKLFQSDFLDQNANRFDLIVTEPPDAPSRSFFGIDKRHHRTSKEIDHVDVIQFPSFAKRVLKSGGYVLLFTKVNMFQEWFKSFRATGFNCMEGMYVFGYDPKTVPRRQINEFPQYTMMTDYGLLARAPGHHPKQFVPDFDSAFHQLPITGTRRSMVLHNIPYVKNKVTFQNTRMPVCLTEKNVDLIHELVDLFSPIQGSVLDPFGGAFSTAVACMRSSRSCVALEADERVYKVSLERLLTVLRVPTKAISKTKKPTRHHKDRHSAENDVELVEDERCASGNDEDQLEHEHGIVHNDNDIIEEEPSRDCGDEIRREGVYDEDHMEEGNGNDNIGEDDDNNINGSSKYEKNSNIDEALLLLKMNRTPQIKDITHSNNNKSLLLQNMEAQPGTRRNNAELVVSQLASRGRYRRSKRSLPSMTSLQKKTKNK